ncbi:hypothetical protein WOC76_05175 [Methylocystis sp. IM3]|uniref:hypothetical protein n=1 Tax=unclassified Methylocystis TaxID=2625913 RepID=UPI0030F7F5F9
MRLAFIFFMTAAVIGMGAGLLLLAQDSAPDTLVHAKVGGVSLAYARAYARDDATAAGGLTDRLGFVVSFPDFSPLPMDRRSQPRSSITMVLTTKEDGPEPQDRLTKVYTHFLTPDTLVGPGGLVRRRFEAGSPYDLEELFVAAPDGRNFFARCLKRETRTPGEDCFSVFRDGALDVELRYPASLLEQWDALYDGSRALVRRMRARAR